MPGSEQDMLPHMTLIPLKKKDRMIRLRSERGGDDAHDTFISLDCKSQPFITILRTPVQCNDAKNLDLSWEEEESEEDTSQIRNMGQEAAQ
uniref:Protein phosphatase 1 regulatory subunit 1B n=1 Tax=Steinernema glaseri TaxID=37863 RepID=A0A1I7ZLE9_9BILA